VVKIQIRVFPRHKHISKDYIEGIRLKEILITIQVHEFINTLSLVILILSKLVKDALMLLRKLVVMSHINIMMNLARPKKILIFPIYNQKEEKLAQKGLKFLDLIS